MRAVHCASRPPTRMDACFWAFCLPRKSARSDGKKCKLTPPLLRLPDAGLRRLHLACNAHGYKLPVLFDQPGQARKKCKARKINFSLKLRAGRGNPESFARRRDPEIGRGEKGADFRQISTGFREIRGMRPLARRWRFWRHFGFRGDLTGSTSYRSPSLAVRCPSRCGSSTNT